MGFPTHFGTPPNVQALGPLGIPVYSSTEQLAQETSTIAPGTIVGTQNPFTLLQASSVEPPLYAVTSTSSFGVLTYWGYIYGVPPAMYSPFTQVGEVITADDPNASLRIPQLGGHGTGVAALDNEGNFSWSLPSGGGLTITPLTTSGTLAKNSVAWVHSNLSAISVNLVSTTVLGDIFVVTDFGMNASVNNITVHPLTGFALEDPNFPGAFLAVNTPCVFVQDGASAQWRSDGSSKLKLSF